jgi:hypothetical protein
LTVAALAAAAGLLAPRHAGAQKMCNDATMFPNPIIVAGSAGFEVTIARFAFKLAMEPSPTTIVFAGNAYGSCAGIASVASGADLAGTTGYTYTQAGTSFNREPCTFAAGQKVDVAASDVFYESCPNLPQPMPADLRRVTGPVQATVFIVPAPSATNTTLQYLTYQEAQALYGCGVPAAPLLGISDPMAVFCANPGSGHQVTVARGIGLQPSVLASSMCVSSSDATYLMVRNVANYPLTAARGLSIGFMTVDALAAYATTVTALAFQAQGQTTAFFIDSRPDFADRRNVRDGHYTLWGYEHLFAKTSGGNLSKQATDFIGWVTGGKTSPGVDYVPVEGLAGLIPLCAMRVQRTSDGGPLSPYSPAEPCACAYQAIINSAIPPGCAPCVESSTCASGTGCHRGFCE